MNSRKNLLKWKENFVALSLACILPFTCTACNSSKNKAGTQHSNITTEETQNSVKSEEELETFSWEEEINREMPTEELTLEEEPMDNTDIASYLDVITKIPVMYHYEEYYITYEQVEELIEESKKDLTCSYVYDKDLDTAIADLLIKIESNSLAFLENNPEYERALWISDEFPSELLNSNDIHDHIKKNFSMILENALQNIFKTATNDIAEDLCMLENIAIVFTNSEDLSILGSYDPDQKVLFLNINSLCHSSNLANVESTTDNTLVLNEEVLKEIELTLMHELNHVRQQMCPCKISQNPEYSEMTYQNNVTFLMESSAESSLYNLDQDPYEITKSTFDYTYYEERQKESLIMLLGLMHDDVKIEDYYNAIYDSSLEEFYEYCGVKTEEEKYTLHKIWYAIDSLSLRNEFAWELTGETSFTVGQLKELVGSSYRVDIFKLILQHMLNYTYENNIPLEENLAVFDIVKNLIIADIYITQKEESTIEGYTHIYEEDVVKAIVELEQLYIEFLSDFYQIEIEEIRKIETENSYVFDCYLLATGTTNGDTKAASLLEKYPILKYALVPNFVSDNNYYTFLEDNGLTLRRNMAGNYFY